MDTWLKALVAAACCVVIAGGGYFVFLKMQERQDAAIHAQAMNNAKAHLFELAKAGDDDQAKVREFCALLDKFPEIVTPEKGSRDTLATCRAFGFI